MKPALVSWLAGAIAAVTCAGCLFRTAEAPRFYRPGSAALDGADGTPTAPPHAGAPLRLHSVRSAPFLRERVVWRASPVEYGLYEQRRWFELPTHYVRRALTTALQNTPGLRLDDDAQAPRLDVEILAFDEMLAPTHQARVELAVTLRHGTEERFAHLYAAQAPIASTEGAAMAEAMGRALDEVVQQVTRAAAAALAKQPAAHTPRPPRGRGVR